MKLKDVIHLRFQCNRCKAEWWPAKPQIPERCPKCNSPYWNKERVRINQDK